MSDELSKIYTEKIIKESVDGQYDRERMQDFDTRHEDDPVRPGVDTFRLDEVELVNGDLVELDVEYDKSYQNPDFEDFNGRRVMTFEGGWTVSIIKAFIPKNVSPEMLAEYGVTSGTQYQPGQEIPLDQIKDVEEQEEWLKNHVNSLQ
jgi:hypothetical protein